MDYLKPWALAPFELLNHAEMHLRDNSDFDKRMALVSFDNSIESSISTYLMLKPTQRNGQQFQKSDVEKWLNNYHSKIEFFEHFVLHVLKKQMEIEREDIIFYHGLRNELYHQGNGFVPGEIHVQGIRKAAIWIFSSLFKVDNIDVLLSQKGNNFLSSTQYVSSSVSPENAFLESFSSFKKEINDLLETKSRISNEEIKLSVTEILSEMASNNPEILPNQTAKLLEKAGEIRDVIIQGKSVEETPAELETITSQLVQLNDEIASNLRSYQRQTVESAVLATVKAIDAKNQKIGVIHQAIGSGLSATLLSFVLKIKTNPALRHLPILILSDRNVIKEQLYQTLVKALGDHAELAIMATNQSSLQNGLSLDQPKIIFSTVQLGKLDHQGFIFSHECLVVGYETQQLSELEKLVPKGFFILFTSMVGKNREYFGDLIAQYKFSDAVEHGYILPVKIENRYLDKAINFGKDQIGKKGFEFLASDILHHFSLRQSQYSGKGLIVVPSIEFGMKLQKAMLEVKPKNISTEIIHGGVSHTVISVLFERFSNENDDLSLIVTAGMWTTGIENTLINVVYLLNSMPEHSLMQIISRTNRKYKNKDHGLVVDYVGIDWMKIKSEFIISF